MPGIGSRGVGLLLVLVVLVPLGVLAEDPYGGLDTTGTPLLPPRDRAVPWERLSGPKRTVPRYDGRVEPAPTAGEALIWVPRAVLLPAHLVINGLVAGPVVKLVTLGEEHLTYKKVRAALTFAERRAGVLPTAFVDFGLDPSLGIYFFYNDLAMRGHDFHFRFGFWFTNWYHLVANDSIRVFRGGTGKVSFRGEFITRPDMVFYGLGPLAMEANETYFRQRTALAQVSFQAAFTDLTRLTIGQDFRNVNTSGGKDPSLTDRFSPFDIDDPREVPGFDRTYNMMVTRATLELDSRDPDRVHGSGSGLRLELLGSFSFDPGDLDLNFWRYGGEVAGFWDISGHNHVLSLAYYLESMVVTGPAVVPFTELIILGGMEHLRAFKHGRWRGESATELALSYRWPVWPMADAELFWSLGNVFGENLEGFDLGKLVMSVGVGFRAEISPRILSLDILLGFGSNQLERWDQGYEITEVRFMVGLNRGF